MYNFCKGKKLNRIEGNTDEFSDWVLRQRFRG